MKRSCLIVITTAATVVALALPGLARAEDSTDGWSWNDGAAAVADSGVSTPSPDGWSWGDAAPESAPAASG